MKIEHLDISHQNLIEKKFQQLDVFLSEFSFANLYLFRHTHRYELMSTDNEIFIRGTSRDGIQYIMLTSDPKFISKDLLRSILLETSILFPIPEIWLTSLTPFLLQTSFKEEDSDYLFNVSKLASLPGRSLENKRNLVKQLFRQNAVKSENLAEQLSDALKILDQWQEDRKDSFHETDYYSCQEALKHFHQLKLHGRIIYINDQPAGFTIGEWINKDCYAVHFSKALQKIKGLYQHLDQDIAQSVLGTCSWMNMEQDLGIPSIRFSKRSYLPDQILPKWRVQC